MSVKLLSEGQISLLTANPRKRGPMTREPTKDEIIA